jgi:hypothetical protein
LLKGAFICGSDSSADNRFVMSLPATAPVRRRTGALAALRTALAALLLSACALPIAWGGSRGDHERAHAAVRAGEVLPLATLLERLQRTHPGQVLELELDREDGRWIYEIKLLQANGQLLRLELDAGTGQVLEVRRKARPRKGSPG